MARYSYPSKYFADDKDIADLLGARKFSKKKLLNLAQNRSIFLSHDLSRESIIDYLSQIPFSWPQLQELLEFLETVTQEEKVTACRLDSSATEDQLSKVLSDLRDIRGDTANESYLIKKKGGATTVTITYSEIDTKSTRALQRVHKEIVIAIVKGDSGFEVRYPFNARAQTIVDKIEGMLPILKGEEKPKRETVDLAGIHDPGLRSDFFVTLMDSMDGYKRRDVIDLKLNRFTSLAIGDDSLDEEKSDDLSAKLKGLVKRTSLAGESLLNSPEYQQFSRGGFSVYRVVWEAMERTGQGRVFELEAQFRKIEEGTGFNYLIRGMRGYDDDGELGPLKRKLLNDDRKRLTKSIEDAAFSSAKTIRTKSK